MACSSTGKRVPAVWLAVIVCLGAMGCRAQFSFHDDSDAAKPAPVAAAAAPQKTSPPAAKAAPADPAGPAPQAKSSPPDERFVATLATKQAAKEMGVAALTGKEIALEPAAAAPAVKAPPSAADAVGRTVPHYPPSQPTTQVALFSQEAPDPSSEDKPAPKKDQAPAVLADLAGQGSVVEAAPPHPLPNEKAKTTLPAYVIEPPDVLIIEGVRLIPKPPYRIDALDVLYISVPNALPGQPIAGPYTVTPDGTINLGFGYGGFRVVGLTLEEAAAALKAGLRINNPQVSVALAQFRAIQQVRGDHIVGQDGTISLGSFGCVNVTGLTLSQAKCEIERHLARWLQDPLISVSIGGYNSKVYYVITDGAGFGQQVYRMPITGNETVLDAISNINGLPPVSSKRNIWLARPTPALHGCYQILPVNWEAITMAGSSETNWQLFPGDRVYVKADPFITIDNTLAKVLNPLERIMGFALLGSATVQSLQFRNGGNGNGVNNGF